MTREAVVDLLGRGTRSERGLDYPLGEWSGFRIDCDYLHVEFDSRNRLLRAYAWQS